MTNQLAVCCPLCSSMEELYLGKVSYDYNEEMSNYEEVEE